MELFHKPLSTLHELRIEATSQRHFILSLLCRHFSFFSPPRSVKRGIFNFNPFFPIKHLAETLNKNKNEDDPGRWRRMRKGYVFPSSESSERNPVIDSMRYHPRAYFCWGRFACLIIELFMYANERFFITVNGYKFTPLSIGSVL